MARPAKRSEDMFNLARQMARQAKTPQELRTGLSVLIPEYCGASNAKTAEVLCVGVATVVRMQKQIRDQVRGAPSQKGNWGGRRRQLLSLEEEKAFLEPWVQKAEKGGVLVVPPIHDALEKRLGHKVAESTVYRMLARHGWRKVAPDTCHPERNPEAQEDFKKNSQRRWMRLPRKTS